MRRRLATSIALALVSRTRQQSRAKKTIRSRSDTSLPEERLFASGDTWTVLHSAFALTRQRPAGGSLADVRRRFCESPHLQDRVALRNARARNHLAHFAADETRQEIVRLSRRGRFECANQLNKRPFARQYFLDDPRNLSAIELPPTEQVAVLE